METLSPPLKTARLQSLDFYRGMTMFLLIAEGAGVYSALHDMAPESGFFAAIIQQFDHHPWNGLRFWDLIQPFFMFIVGVAMAFSITKRLKLGATWTDNFKHFLYRCLMLLLLGVVLHCGYNKKLVWELWNVLSQLSVTIMIAFLIFKLKIRTQLLISFGLLLLTELLYRFWPVEGFNQPFVADENFGSWMDMLLMGKLSGGHWVAINCIPTAAHTIWGVLAGKILLSERTETEKIKIFVIAGIAGLVAGYGLDWTGVTPIIKRICTSSFVIASGGWCLLTLALSYWFIDVKGYKKWTLFFAIVGMSPIFIYMFSQTLGGQWFNGFVHIFTDGILGWFGTPESVIKLLTALVIWGVEWYLCYWLYKKKIIIKI
ncbi:DUF5009 domain-containing protein [candidate division KSB1 bacterium]|nr:DUF5009 domain-containing protein [candidate division KSB1 bacterium]